MKYTLRDIVYSAITASAMNVLSYILVPLVLAVPVPGMRNLVVAPFYGLLLALALYRIDKRGVMTLISFFNGVVLLFISPVILGFLLISGLAADVSEWLIWRRMGASVRIVGSCAVYMAAMAVVGTWFGALFLGEMPAADLLRSSHVLALVALLCGGSSALGAVVSLKLSREFSSVSMMKG